MDNDEICPGEAVIKDGMINIQVPVEHLPMIVKCAYDLDALPLPYRVTDPELFAKDLVLELNDEDEVGGTRVHKMFDAAIADAISRGAEGIEEAEEDTDA